ncbi:MAG: 8-amino-7-oxononanoate synthase [Bacteroidales bacterium]|nr:8-amino-7-oxononanoate synthase [Bacteroidales bacterium]
MDYYRRILEELEQKACLRTIPASEPCEIVDFSSNDYLGLAARSELLGLFVDEKRQHGQLPPMTSSASRLLAAHQEEYEALESFLRTLYGRDALLFNSGYHANTGLISALCHPKTLILADRLVHASIIDGIKLSGADFARFRHGDYAHLQTMLERRSKDYQRVWIVVESVYSMDGDSADIDRLVELKRSVDNASLYVDEAHAIGVCGPRGLGLCKASSGFGDVDVVVGTFGKALASMGAFAIMSEELRSFAINRSRSFIFSTALPPACCAWSRFMLERAVAADDERSHLRRLASRLYEGLRSLRTLEGDRSAGTEGVESHIQPYIIGDAALTVDLSRRLMERGLKVLPIRVPTVPPGTERLRISLSAAMREADVERLVESLSELRAN